MEVKKNDNVNLEKKKPIFYQIGFIISLILALVVIEIGTVNRNNKNAESFDDIDIIVEISYKPQYKEQLELIQKPKVIDELLIIGDDDIEYSKFKTNIVIDYKSKAIILEEIEDDEEDDIEEFPMFFVEEMPKYPGGIEALKKHIVENINYPIIAKENNIQGKVFVRFIINKNGNIGKVSIIKSANSVFDNEAIRVINTLSTWKAGMQNGKNVSVWYTVPINFVLK